MIGVFIGRFQPCHLGHLHICREALKQCEKLAFVIGSHNAARSLRNPFTSTEREEMILGCLTPEEKSRVVFLKVRDYFYKPEFWINEVREKVRMAAKGEGSVVLFGFQKDFTSDYLSWFPDWQVKSIDKKYDLNATQIRDEYLRDSATISSQKLIPDSVRDWMMGFAKSEEYKNLKAERRAIDEYRKSWSQAPYPPVFVTTDSLITQAGHILLIRRGKAPGKGLLALPGGFLDPDETLESCALRELEEETHFGVSKEELKKSLVAVKAFDHPLRSSRGRTITHVHHFKLSGDRLADFRSDDDAAEALWMPILDLAKIEDQFFEDHFHIINHFLRSY
jgi:bifunctional NMN adenylyltransferase/nudix hydrolase